MYYPYDFEESEENVSEPVSVSDDDVDVYQDELFANHFYHTPSHSISSKNEDEEEEDDVIDQSRIFNYAEVKVFLDEVICPICCQIIVNPRVCKECDQSFCGRCIEKWFQNSNQQCPCCRKSKISHSNAYQNLGIMEGKVPKVLLKLLSKLLLTCRYSQDGCEEIITYDFREKHENNYCQYQQLDCPNQGCEEIMFRKDLEDHYLECQYGSVQCKYCSEDKLRMEIESHLYECPCRPILCEWCQEKQQAIEFNEHLELCEFKDIFCQYCKKKYKRYDMKIHTPIFCLNNLYENSLELLQQKDERIFELQKQIEYLKSSKLMEQSDLNQSTYEVLSEKYKQDFEEDVEEVIEEDIQIEESDQELEQQLDKANQNQLSQENYENLDKRFLKEGKQAVVEIQPFKNESMSTRDDQLNNLWYCSDVEINQMIDFFNI
ncbi:unnamed protein product (macronuclear) [Paramecium tetraurelia]|uniref:RING-type domain-containing protein n=1 Tax=Paramecium tetraurelia TaxID=5888 RepID=A0D196_PARTE|nr:uncharacterized protein GSPATT00012337001 [Paramecium tetraurelia]CAK76813.1 unnamed protein product [Paramecium tetraurelia]|eukprot:XP_001444210.1 hypothetical protein (macronuclear) [Paramecium tetraurelia strain d4-2]